MAQIETELATWLKAQPAIAALVGARIYPAHLPQDQTLPAITLEREGGEPIGAMGGSTATSRATIRFDYWAQAEAGGQYTLVKSIADAVRAVFDRYRGALDDLTVSGAFLRSEEDSPEPPEDATDMALEHVTQSYEVWYK